MIDKDAMRKELLKTVEGYVQDVIPKGERVKARKILKEISERKIVKASLLTE